MTAAVHVDGRRRSVCVRFRFPVIKQKSTPQNPPHTPAHKTPREGERFHTPLTPLQSAGGGGAQLKNNKEALFSW